MIKISNWLFGSFFRTLGRVIAFIFLGFLAFVIFQKLNINIDLPDFIKDSLILKVNASNNNRWALDLPRLNNVVFRECNSSSCSTNLSVDNPSVSPAATYTQFTYSKNSTPVTIGPNGYSIMVPMTFEANFLYQVDFYICSNVDLSTGYSYDIGATTYGNGLISHTYMSVGSNMLGQYPYTESLESGGPKFSYCRHFTSVSYGESFANWGSFRIRRSSGHSNVSNVTLSLISYTIEPIGRSNPSIVSILNSSGLATNSSVQSINNTVTDVKNELNGVNDSVNDVNNSVNAMKNEITSEAAPDVGNLDNIVGYLPPGPLDSVLNLPLSILNSLNNKLSSTCTPLNVNLPFVDIPLSIPCISSIFSNITGLSELWESLGVIFGALILYKYLVYLYSWVDETTSLKNLRPRLFGANSNADNWGGVE